MKIYKRKSCSISINIKIFNFIKIRDLFIIFNVNSQAKSIWSRKKYADEIHVIHIKYAKCMKCKKYVFP